jgi:hypothetical protein
MRIPKVQTVEPLQQARAALTGHRLATAHAARRLSEHGWTPGTYAWLRVVGMHAHAVHAGPSWPTSVPTSGWDSEADVLRRIVGRAEGTVEHGIDFEVAWPWIAAWASVTDAQNWILLNGGIRFWRTAGAGVRVRTWTRRVGPLAAFAWLAGLEMDEAVTLRQGGHLDESRLRALIALRRISLPVRPTDLVEQPARPGLA